MAQTRHDPDSELLAQGVANIVTPFFGGIAATGAIARTATNFRAGARSPVAAMTHAVVILVAVLGLSPLLSYLPMASLAALLLVVAWNMSDAKHFARVLRIAPRSDLLVMLVCYGLTVGFDMVVGVAVGMVLASFLFMRRMAEVTQVQLVRGPHPSVAREVPPGVILYEISGPLFFGAAQKAMGALQVAASDAKAVVLSMEGVDVLDATGLVALESAVERLKRSGCLAVLSGLKEQPRRLLERADWQLRPLVSLCSSVTEALRVAEEYVAALPASKAASVRP
jgi:SulP family sulfate permease